MVLTGYLHRLAARTLLVTTSGNHDLDGPGEAGEQVAGWLRRLRSDGLHVDGARVDADETRFTLCPWWDGPETKTQVEALLARDAEDRPRRWIWLYHSPPGGTGLCRTSRKEFPDHDLAAWVERWQPDLVFCGHVHQAPWVANGGWAAQLGRTWAFNAGRQIGPIPAHVVIDTEAEKASWYGIPEQDEVSLG